MESVSNIRTVASLRLERLFLDRFEKALATDLHQSRWEPYIKGLSFSLVPVTINFSYFGASFYGAHLIADGEINIVKFFRYVPSICGQMQYFSYPGTDVPIAY